MFKYSHSDEQQGGGTLSPWYEESFASGINSIHPKLLRLISSFNGSTDNIPSYYLDGRLNDHPYSV